jgi:beta-galactosidase
MKKNFEGAPDYLNPTVLGIHKEEAHFEGVSYLSENDFDNGVVRTALSLNGQWKFKLYRNPHSVDLLFTRVDDESSKSWDEIVVPGVWELQGYGTPYYLAKTYPPQLKVKASQIPSISETDNPTGAYVTNFTLPDNFNDQRIYLRFGAVKSAFQVWINGIQAGFSKASMTSHEFEITPWIKPGSNKVAVLVYKYSDGTYLEDQDMWFFGGICRDVSVFCEPKTYIFDAFASCDLTHDYTDAHLKLDLTLKGSPDSDLVLKVILSYTDDQLVYQGKPESLTLHIEKLIKKPDLWTAETPSLYTVKLYLYQGKTLIQAKKFKFGFRSIEIKDSKFLINGRPIKFKGVNRHDFDPQLAWGITKETRLKDLLIMKAHNINAIRTSHYPNPTHLYELADELGLYVIDEADLETHGIRNILPRNNKIWGKACIDRNQRMVLKDRNHPSIVMWSLGNEAGEGSVFMDIRNAVKALDQTRPIHYEGDKQKGLSDVYSMMYPSPAEEIKFGEKQDITYRTLVERATQLFLTRKPLKKEDYQDLPVMNCEYAHCMENSLGNFKEHVDNFEKYDNWIGGFIWDFVDQSIKHIHSDGSIEWRYGGDFHEEVTDAFFCANGLIASDRSLHPAISEVKQVYSNLSISHYQPEDHTVLISNKNVFIDTSSVLFIAKILCDGVMISQELLSVDPILPKSQKRVTIGKFVLPETPGEIILQIDAVEKEDRPWAKQGHEICFGQFILRTVEPKLTIKSDLAALKLHQTRTSITIQGESFTAAISAATGCLNSLDYGQGNVLKSPLTYNFTRADIDNDCGIELFVPLMSKFNPIRAWEKAQAKILLHRIDTIVSKPDQVTFRIRHKMPLLSKFETRMTFYADGQLTVTVHIKPKKDMVRFGMTLGLDHEFRNVEFYGRGPQENYIDRKSGSKIGLYQGTIQNFIHDYMRPQENGNHTDVRYLHVCNTEGILRFHAMNERLLETSVWPYTQKELKKTTHIHQLPAHRMTTVNLDYGQKGVAGDLPGFYQGPKEYHLEAKQDYHYGFSITYEQSK